MVFGRIESCGSLLRCFFGGIRYVGYVGYVVLGVGPFFHTFFFEVFARFLGRLENGLIFGPGDSASFSENAHRYQM